VVIVYSTYTPFPPKYQEKTTSHFLPHEFSFHPTASISSA
jgi:hypothetical protein